MFVMQMKYIFMRKTNLSEKDFLGSININIFTKMFEVLFKNVTNNSFDILYDGYLCTVKYKHSSNESRNTHYVTLSIEGTIALCAKVLNEVNAKLLKGSHRKEYNIIITFDCISHYYCNKIYPKFNLFERKIRELIFRILIKSLGNDWYDVTFPQELKNELKKQGLKQSDLIERALYEMTISQLETYLFEPFRIIELDNVIDDKLNRSSVNKMTKEEIVEIIDLCRARSLWERFFKDIKINKLQENLDIVRKYRNSVAHSKYFYKDDYIECNRILNKLIKQIENAIETIDAKPFSLIDIGKTLGALAGTITLLFVPTLKSMFEASKINMPKMIIHTQMEEQIKAISESAKMISTQMAEQMKLISEASKINIPKISIQMAEQMKLISEVSKISIPKISTQMTDQMKLISEASKIGIPKINTQFAEQVKEEENEVITTKTSNIGAHDEETKNTDQVNIDKDNKETKTSTYN